MLYFFFPSLVSIAGPGWQKSKSFLPFSFSLPFWVETSRPPPFPFFFFFPVSFFCFPPFETTTKQVSAGRPDFPFCFLPMGKTWGWLFLFSLLFFLPQQLQEERSSDFFPLFPLIFFFFFPPLRFNEEEELFDLVEDSPPSFAFSPFLAVTGRYPGASPPSLFFSFPPFPLRFFVLA